MLFLPIWKDLAPVRFAFTVNWSTWLQFVDIKGRHGSGNNGNFDSGQSKSKVCSYISKHRADTVVQE